MTHSLLVVEGAHDASFFGLLLRAKGYQRSVILPDVPDFWKPLIPRRYPVDPEGRLDRVIRLPDVYCLSGDDTVGIQVAGGENRLVASLTTALERLGIENFAGVGIVLDTDHEKTARERFAAFVKQLEALNESAVAEGVSGFPLLLPAVAGRAAAGVPRVGVHLFPDNNRQGTLETILLECVRDEHPLLTRAAGTLVMYADRKSPSVSPPLRRMRRASGRAKAQAGILANLLHPGASLAVSLHDDNWGITGVNSAAVRAASDFLAEIM